MIRTNVYTARPRKIQSMPRLRHHHAAEFYQDVLRCNHNDGEAVISSRRVALNETSASPVGLLSTDVASKIRSRWVMVNVLGQTSIDKPQTGAGPTFSQSAALRVIAKSRLVCLSSSARNLPDGTGVVLSQNCACALPPKLTDSVSDTGWLSPLPLWNDCRALAIPKAMPCSEPEPDRPPNCV